MKLKTAALIAIICFTLHFIINFLWLMVQPILSPSIPTLRLFDIFNMLLIDGSIVLFFLVLYFKQKMPRDIDRVFEIEPIEQGISQKGGEYSDMKNDTQNIHIKRINGLSVASFILSILAIPFVIVSSIIIRKLYYDPNMTEIAELTGRLSFILLPTSFFSGVAGLIHIALKRKKYRGYWLALVGIFLSMILVVTLFYNIFQGMAEHLW